MSNLWQGLKNAQVFERGNYFAPGTYDLEITRCLVKQTQKSGLGFIVEFEVLNSNNPEHAPGSKGTWFQSMKSPAIALSAIKSFVLAVLGLNLKHDADTIAARVEPVIEPLMDQATSEINPFYGMRVHLEAFHTKTQAGGDFTVHNFEPFKGPDGQVVKPDLDAVLGLAKAGGAIPPPPPAEMPVSPDGRYQWNGTAWIPRT